MQPFSYTALPAKVVFGFGTIAGLGDEIRALGARRALLLSTPGRAAAALDDLKLKLGDLAAGSFSEAAMHTPVAVTERALQAVAAADADCVVALGGGSTIGLAKAIALRTDLPQIVLPTTYAGSEATPVLGETRDGVKTTQRTLKVLPEVILYDVELTLDLPLGVSVASGLNAMAHAAEGLYARDANPIVARIAEDGLTALARALPRLAAAPRDREARSDALYGAWACGMTLGAVGMALHHKLCHVLGGTFGLPHAETHAVVLPHALAYNAAAAPQAMARMAQAIGAAEAPAGVYELATSLGAPRSLAALGLPPEGIAQAVALTLADPYWNPAPLDAARLRALLEDAYEGRPPRVAHGRP
jgi:alcohol dehydrogenase class IV